MFSDPVKNLKQFGLREDMIVADLGAGTGFYSMAVAEMVPKGKVYAIEIQKDFLTTVTFLETSVAGFPIRSLTL